MFVYRCQNLKYLTLDFSNAMQLHDFNDMNSFPCNLRSLTICLSEVIFMEGFMRKVYQHLSSLEVLHLIGSLQFVFSYTPCRRKKVSQKRFCHIFYKPINLS